MNASQDISGIIGYLVRVLTPHSCHRVKSRISRKLTSPRKFRRAVLCTSRVSRSSASPCALRLSCVSPRGSAERGIREPFCVHRAVPNSDGSAPALRLLVPHGCFSSRWGGRVSFLTAAYFAELHNRVIATADILSACFTFYMYRLILLLSVFGSAFQSLVDIAVRASKSFLVRRSSKLPR